MRTLFICLLLAACSHPTTSTTGGSNDQPVGPGATIAGAGIFGHDAIVSYAGMSAADRDAVGQTKVLFHHHSVGENIMGAWTDDGSAGGAESLGFHFTTANAPSDYPALSLGEISGGSNSRPLEKVASLRTIVVDQQFGAVVDVVAFKLCYLDFGSGSDAGTDQGERALEAAYVAAVEAMTSAYPELTVVHVTPPLNNYWNSGGNERRAAFADFLRSTYGKDGFVFDLQDVVSHDSNGNACERNGVPVACDEHLGKTGHLSGEGATAAAKVFLYTLLQTRTR